MSSGHLHAFFIATAVCFPGLLHAEIINQKPDTIKQVLADIKKTEDELLKVDHLRNDALKRLSIKQHPYPIKKVNVSPNNDIQYSLAQKDYLRYPAAKYPAYFKFDLDQYNTELEFHAWMQADQDIFFNAKGVNIYNGLIDITNYNKNTVDRFWLRRLRPSLEGTLADYFNFMINPDFGQDQAQLFDAFVDINYLRILGLQAGLQMSLVSGIENYFDNFSYLSRAYTMEMSNPAMMAPDREVGLVLHGSLGPSGDESYYRGLSYLGFDDLFSYQVGLFNGTPDNSSVGVDISGSNIQFSQVDSISSSKAIEARVFINPFIATAPSVLKHLGIGFAGSYENVESQGELPALVSLGQNTIFKIDGLAATAQGPRSRLHPQAVWYSGPLGVLADWTQTSQQLHTNFYPTDIPGTFQSNSITQKSQASQIQLIYNITQEDFNLFHLEPNNNFHPFERDSYGAWQIVLRLTGLNMDKNVFNPVVEDFYGTSITTYLYADPQASIQKANSWSIGVNWYWTMALRFTMEYARTQFTGGNCPSINGTCLQPSAVTNRPVENIFMQRFQVSF